MSRSRSTKRIKQPPTSPCSNTQFDAASTIPPQIILKTSNGSTITYLQEFPNSIPDLKTTGKSKSTDLPKVSLAKAKQAVITRSDADSIIARLGTLRMT